MFFHKTKKAQRFLQTHKKAALFTIAVFILGGVFGSAFFSAPVSRANILDDLYERIVKGFGFTVTSPNPLDSTVENNQEKAPTNEPTSFALPEPESVIYRDEYEKAIVLAVERADPAVVSIIITKDLPVLERCPYNPFSNLPPEFQQLFQLDGGVQFYQPCQQGTKKQEIGGGSGFLISSDGLVVTNKHVIRDEKAEYTVMTNDGKRYGAKILARHPALDLALLRISGSGFPKLALGDSDQVKLGQTAIVIGNALGEFRNTVSVGVVSGLARNITASDSVGQSEIIENVIQTDAAINPGNSGGPLLNLKGEVIGISVATVSGAQNIGFAIPINAVKRSIQSVNSSGKIRLAFLGVRYVILNPEVAKKLGVSTEYGALLKGGDGYSAVESGSPSEKAGLKEGDVILEMDGKKIDHSRSLAYLISQKNPGDSVTLKILSRGKENILRIVLGERF